MGLKTRKNFLSPLFYLIQEPPDIGYMPVREALFFCVQALLLGFTC